MEHVRKTIDTLVERADQQECELLDTKRMVNSLLKLLNEPPRYNLEVVPADTSPTHGNWRVDEFYGQPLSSVVKRILLSRRAAGLGAATVTEIFTAMMAGGFSFETKDEENAKNTLRSSLRKNSAVFHRLPNGNYGLKEWYPVAKDRPRTNGGPTPTKDEVGAEDDGFDFERKEQEDAARNGQPEKAAGKTGVP